MKFLIVGLGSMGKRRVRCLKALGFEEITGFDQRKDRRAEAEDLYGIRTISSLRAAGPRSFDALVISTPPDMHKTYMELALKLNRPAFVEASVISEGLPAISAAARKKGLLIAPSCTLRFHPAIKDIKDIVKSGRYGKVTNLSYHSGQYLPDWHPWEPVKDYYVSRQQTGGGREIVPFELTWFVDVLGFPKDIKGFFGGTMDVGADIADTYSVVMRWRDFYGTMLVDVVSRYAVRHLILNMERGQIMWRWDQPRVNLYDAPAGRWITYGQKQTRAARGYNVNIAEEMYIEEISAFVAAVQGRRAFPNTLDDDIRVLRLLEKAEARQ